MSEETLVAELNRLGLGEFTDSSLEALVRTPNAALETRIAAILLIVSCSDLSIAVATGDLICTLTDPDGEPHEEFTDRLRRNIIRLLQAPREELLRREGQPMGERMAALLIQFSESRTEVPNESLDSTLRLMTGQNADWWLDWIREQKAKGQDDTR